MSSELSTSRPLQKGREFAETAREMAILETTYRRNSQGFPHSHGKERQFHPPPAGPRSLWKLKVGF